MYKQTKTLVSVLLIFALMFAPIQPAAALHADTPAPPNAAVPNADAPNQAVLVQDSKPLIAFEVKPVGIRVKSCHGRVLLTYLSEPIG